MLDVAPKHRVVLEVLELGDLMLPALGADGSFRDHDVAHHQHALCGRHLAGEDDPQPLAPRLELLLREEPSHQEEAVLLVFRGRHGFSGGVHALSGSV